VQTIKPLKSFSFPWKKPDEFFKKAVKSSFAKRLSVKYTTIKQKTEEDKKTEHSSTINSL